jgi:hypothetical protein
MSTLDKSLAELGKAMASGQPTAPKSKAKKSRTPAMRWPKISEVASDLKGINNAASSYFPDEGTEDEPFYIDVRLQVYEDGNWAIRSGDSQYDQDHRGYWGSSSVPGSGKPFKATETARELIEQAKDSYAMSR